MSKNDFRLKRNFNKYREERKTFGIVKDKLLKYFITPEKVVFNARNSNVFWFKENGKFMRCKGKRVFMDRKTLITFDEKEEIKYVINLNNDSKYKAIELGIPVVHPRSIYGDY